MRRLLIALALLGLPPAAAGAEDLTFCHQGRGAQEAGDHDLAIAFYTRCLNEGDRSHGNQAATHNNRGYAYSNKSASDRARTRSVAPRPISTPASKNSWPGTATRPPASSAPS